MNIKAIRLINFRGFENARIDLKPLTVLLGPNSAGKSSFGQALAAMAHVHRSYKGGPQATLTPSENRVDEWPVDLGKTNDLRRDGATGAVQVELETAGGKVKLGFGGLGHTDHLILSYVAFPSGELSATGKLTHATVDAVPKGQISEVVPIEVALKVTSSVPVSKDVIEITKTNELFWREGATEVSVILDGLIVKAVQHLTGTSRIVSGAASDDLRSLLEKLTYLRANRKRPTRGYKDGAHEQQPIGYSGEYTPTILLANVDNQVTYAEPPIIPNSVDEALNSCQDWKGKQERLGDALNEWLSRLDIATNAEIVAPLGASEKLHMRVAPKGQSNHDITEIGFGVSQVVPVLVAGLLQPKDGLLIVDLPEAHLHPRPQSEIADFFCSLALSGRTVLVETHSEMFFHRLRLRAAQNSSLMEQIAVYFIDRPTEGKCVEPRLVDLRSEGDLYWPEGFLQEAWEAESQINSVREAQRLARE